MKVLSQLTNLAKNFVYLLYKVPMIDHHRIRRIIGIAQRYFPSFILNSQSFMKGKRGAILKANQEGNGKSHDMIE